jgi:excisionase family DNA binding protein
MNSNLRIAKVCEYCKQEFIARTTVTQCCSDVCAKRLYKLRLREKAISRAVTETEARRKPQGFVTEEQVKVIQAKEWLTLVEAALLLNISPLTLRRWVLAGKIRSEKVGRKYLLGFSRIFQQLKGKGIGLSTLSKFLYFFGFTLEGYRCLILDSRIIEVLNAGTFVDLKTGKTISEWNKFDCYIDYLQTMETVSKRNRCSVDQLELFLFQFGRNLKAANS